MPEITTNEWDRFLSDHPGAHILQTSEWGELKSAYGWKPVSLLEQSERGCASIAAMLLFRRLPLGMSVGYIAKGPIGEHIKLDDRPYWTSFCSAVDPICHREKAVFLKVEPDEWMPSTLNRMETFDLDLAAPPGFQPSLHNIQPKQTLVVDLKGGEEEILARMNRKPATIFAWLKKGA